MGTRIDIKIKAAIEGTKEVKQLEKDLSALGKIESFKKLKKDVQESKAAWHAAQAEASKLAKEIKAVGKPTKDLSNRFKIAKNAAAKLKTEFQQDQQALHKLRISLKEAGVDTGKLSAEQKRLRKSLAQTRQEASKSAKISAAFGSLNIKPLKDIQKEIEKLENAYTTLEECGMLSSEELYRAKVQLKNEVRELRGETEGWIDVIAEAQVAIGALAAVGFLFATSFSGFSEFSQRMAEVNTLLDVSQQQLAALSKEILDLSIRIPQTANELAAAEYDIISAGVALENSTRVLELSAKAAVAGVTDTKTAVNVGVGVINAYGKSIDKLDGVYDVLFQTVKSGVTTFPELAQHIGEVLPVARSAGVQFHEVAAAIAVMTKAGIRTPQAATAIKGAINAMAAPTPEAKKKFDALGITWEGLLPTLEAIRKKGLAVDQMRFLIPDVEARTGVLALTQNMDDLKEKTDDMIGSAGSMSGAFEKMKDTPENQIKLFKNEISELGIELGEFVSKWLLPTIKGIRLLKDSVAETDRPTKILLATMGGGGVTFLLWKAGLSKVVLGLKAYIIEARLAGASTGTLLQQFKTASLAMKGGLVISVVYSAIEVWKAIKAFRGMRDAQEHAKESQENLFKITDKVMKKFAEFKDVKLPDDITGTAPEEMEEFRRGLQKAKAYWVALQTELQSKAEETFLGIATKEAKEAQAELKTVNQRLAQIDSDLKKFKTSGESATKAVKATTDQLDDFAKQAKKAYKAAKKEAEKYAKEVIEWEEKIKYARLSTTDKLRELSRKTMTDEKAWNDERLQADEKLYAAKKALKQGDYKLAETLAKDAEGIYAGLAEEIKTTTKDGDQVIAKSLKSTTTVAKSGVKTVGDFMVELYSKQKDNAAESQKKWEGTAKTIQAQLDDIAKKREANIEIKLQNLTDVQEKINKLTKDEIKTITIKTVKTSGETKENGYATGGNLPGYGGGDIVPAMLEPGEFIIRKEAVKKYGNTFMARLNAGLLHNIPKFKTGGPVSQDLLESIRTSTGTNGVFTSATIKEILQAGADLATLRESMHPGKGFLNYHIIPNKAQVVEALRDDSTRRTAGQQDQLISEWHTFLDGEGGVFKTGMSLLKAYQRARKKNARKNGYVYKRDFAAFDYFNEVHGIDAGERVSSHFKHMAAIEIHKIKRKKDGGNISGYGGGDIVPAMLEPGEFVIRKEAVKKYGNTFLARLNAGLHMSRLDALPKFQFGGLVDSISKLNFSIPNIPSIPNISGISGLGSDTSRTVNHSVTLNINGNTVGPLTGDKATINDFISQLKRAQRLA